MANPSPYYFNIVDSQIEASIHNASPPRLSKRYTQPMLSGKSWTPQSVPASQPVRPTPSRKDQPCRATEEITLTQCSGPSLDQPQFTNPAQPCEFRRDVDPPSTENSHCQTPPCSTSSLVDIHIAAGVMREGDGVLPSNAPPKRRLPASFADNPCESSNRSGTALSASLGQKGEGAVAPNSRATQRRRLPASFSDPSSGASDRSGGSCGGVSITDLPIMDFRNHGQIQYGKSAGEVEDMCSNLLRLGVSETGWDIEWRTTYKAGEPPHRTALMQICHATPRGTYVCMLLHIFYAGLTPSLVQYLSNPSITKAGVCARTDAHKVARDFGVAVEGVAELTDHPIVRAQEGLLSRSLASLAEHYMHTRLLKDKVRTSNWECQTLSQDQKSYAATDAFASLRLHQILQALPQPVNMTAVPPRVAQPRPSTSQTPEAAVWIPELAELQRLQPAKLAVYQLLTQQGQSVAQVADQRKCQESTVESYMAEAITAGFGYFWPPPSYPTAALEAIRTLVQQVSSDAGVSIVGREIMQELTAAGTGIRTFQEKLDCDIRFGELRLGLAHLGRETAIESTVSNL